jgi:3-dehydroquinate synthase
MSPQTIIYDFLGQACHVHIGDFNAVTLAHQLTNLLPEASFLGVYDKAVEPLAYALAQEVPFTYTHPLIGGETCKNWETLQNTCEALLPHTTRQHILVVIGGGTVGDLGGLVASLLMRGIRWVYIPTTLLAMVDSSIGGKTAINSPLGKNLLGAFHPPLHVFSSAAFQRSTTQRARLSGYAELVKHALIASEPLFKELATAGPALLEDDARLGAFIYRSVQLKLNIIHTDWLETHAGTRAHLNLGHTFAHAFEKVAGFSLLHGEAVAMGIAYAYALAAYKGYVPQTMPGIVKEHLKQMGLPTELHPALRTKNLITQYVDAMGLDKKNDEQHRRFVLPQGIGQGCVVIPLLPEEIEIILNAPLS